ncbi:unnamed protein product [Heligmosomoides polygyrus]|uniref:Uncharacterized protein n=1 Tax=Heligmosomoides polygyrus TaxID=6339 RepID=A0A183FIA9_HELPZ|nr:unnamed protein product [Heligmosomoides polygyrus]
MHTTILKRVGYVLLSSRRSRKPYDVVVVIVAVATDDDPTRCPVVNLQFPPSSARMKTKLLEQPSRRREEEEEDDEKTEVHSEQMWCPNIFQPPLSSFASFEPDMW